MTRKIKDLFRIVVAGEIPVFCLVKLSSIQGIDPVVADIHAQFDGLAQAVSTKNLKGKKLKQDNTSGQQALAELGADVASALCPIIVSQSSSGLLCVANLQVWRTARDVLPMDTLVGVLLLAKRTPVDTRKTLAVGESAIIPFLSQQIWRRASNFRIVWELTVTVFGNLRKFLGPAFRSKSMFAELLGFDRNTIFYADPSKVPELNNSDLDEENKS